MSNHCDLPGELMQWESNAIRACKGLKNPEREIKALVLAASNAKEIIKRLYRNVFPRSDIKNSDYCTALESALKPFKEL